MLIMIFILVLIVSKIAEETRIVLTMQGVIFKNSIALIVAEACFASFLIPLAYAQRQ